MEEKSEDDTNDEILNELRRKQHELKVISQHNLTVSKKLLKLAQEAMHRQDVHKKMAAADAEVVVICGTTPVHSLAQWVFFLFCLKIKIIMELDIDSCNLILKYAKIALNLWLKWTTI